MQVVVKAATDVGLKRDHNEDNHAVWVPSDPDERATKGTLLLVADGMGGSQAGEVASHLAVESFLKHFRHSALSEPLQAAEAALRTANDAVHRDSLEHPDRRGMGTTCTAVVIRDREVTLAHVGDSRAYLVRNGQIRQLTQDHSLVAQLVRDNQITEEQARVDPRRNVVTRSVGVGPDVEIDTVQLDAPLKDRDTIVVCSDGLHGPVADKEIAAFASSTSLDQGLRGLIDLANERGGPDNITVILARVENLADTAEIDQSEVARIDREDPVQRADFDSTHASAAALTYPSVDDRHASTETPRRTVGQTTLWLILAFVILAMIVSVMGLVVSQMAQESKELGATDRVVHDRSA